MRALPVAGPVRPLDDPAMLPIAVFDRSDLERSSARTVTRPTFASFPFGTSARTMSPVFKAADDLLPGSIAARTPAGVEIGNAGDGRSRLTWNMHVSTLCQRLGAGRPPLRAAAVEEPWRQIAKVAVAAPPP